MWRWFVERVLTSFRHTPPNNKLSYDIPWQTFLKIFSVNQSGQSDSVSECAPSSGCQNTSSQRADDLLASIARTETQTCCPHWFTGHSELKPNRIKSGLSCSSRKGANLHVAREPVYNLPPFLWIHPFFCGGKTGTSTKIGGPHKIDNRFAGELRIGPFLGMERWGHCWWKCVGWMKPRRSLELECSRY